VDILGCIMFIDFEWLRIRPVSCFGMAAGAFFMVSNASLPAQIVNIPIPNALQVMPGGINNLGFIAGTFYQSSVGYRGFITTSHGQPVYTFDAPGGLPTGPPPAAAATYAYDINDFGVVAGTIRPYAVPPSGFLRLPFGNFNPVVVPGSANTQVIRINDLGEVTGYYNGPSGLEGFIRDLRGRYIPVAYPGALFTLVYGSNVRGQVVGEYVDSGQLGHAFVYDVNSSKFTTITVPGGSGASGASGINNAGDIVGSYVVNGNQSFNFIRDARGTFYRIDVPNAGFAGINDLGDLVCTSGQGGFYCRWKGTKDACPMSVIH